MSGQLKWPVLRTCGLLRALDSRIFTAAAEVVAAVPAWGAEATFPVYAVAGVACLVAVVGGRMSARTLHT